MVDNHGVVAPGKFRMRFFEACSLKAHSCENVTDPVTFFQKMSYRGYILFRVRFHSIFFKVIGNLWASYKCHFGRMHHVGSGVITQQRVFSRSAHSQA